MGHCSLRMLTVPLKISWACFPCTYTLLKIFQKCFFVLEKHLCSKVGMFHPFIQVSVIWSVLVYSCEWLKAGTAYTACNQLYLLKAGLKLNLLVLFLFLLFLDS